MNRHIYHRNQEQNQYLLTKQTFSYLIDIVLVSICTQKVSNVLMNSL